MDDIGVGEINKINRTEGNGNAAPRANTGASAAPKTSMTWVEAFVLHPRDLPATVSVLGLVALLVIATSIGLRWSNQRIVDADLAERHHAHFQIDINTAQWPEIASLPRVGPKLAQAIVQWRETNGPFSDIEQLQNVHGIGEKTIARLRPIIAPLKNPAIR